MQEQSIKESIKEPEWIEHKFDELISQQEEAKNTTSDRFTSIKKQRAQNIVKINKFSSSGVGNFQLQGTTSNGFGQLPPMSPTPTTNQFVQKGISKGRVSLTGTNNFMSDQQTEMVEQTQAQFIEYDLGLNNQDQFNNSDEEEKIPEDIVSASSQSGVI